ncbi:MAG: hypothetical protein MJD61_16510 [Proteobacteria bacterium]|nr:hypothetical protein [Pseudomonadota bacterium]
MAETSIRRASSGVGSGVHAAKPGIGGRRSPATHRASADGSVTTSRVQVAFTCSRGAVWRTLVFGMSLTLAASIVGGCRAHIALQAPDPSAPFKRRLAAFRKLKPVHQTYSSYGSISAIDSLGLADGSVVEYPEDVKPVVGPTSPAAIAADLAVARRKWSTITLWSGRTLCLGGAVLALGTDSSTARYAGVGALAAGVVAYIAQHFLESAEGAEMSTAFGTYEDSLRDYLGLCETEEGDLSDCSADGEDEDELRLQLASNDPYAAYPSMRFSTANQRASEERGPVLEGGRP